MMSNAKEKLSKQEKQTKQRERREKVKWFLQINIANVQFVLANITYIAIIFGAIVVSVLDKKYGWMTWDSNAIGVLCQIITAIISFFASTIAIAITLQKEECWGVSVKDFNNLRIGFRYPIVVFVILSISFSALNAVFYVTNPWRFGRREEGDGNFQAGIHVRRVRKNDGERASEE